MTFPVSPSTEMASSHTFESFDLKICRLIYTALYEDIANFVSKGLDPNYILQSDVNIDGMLFFKGSPLLLVILQCCTVSTTPWDLFMMIHLLLDKGADVKKKSLTRGGKAVFWNMHVKMRLLLMKTLL